MANSRNSNRRRRRPEYLSRRTRKRPCLFCSKKMKVDWKDVAVLSGYVSDRAKIRPRRVTGNCPRHQRQVSTAIKCAREMALLSYIPSR